MVLIRIIGDEDDNEDENFEEQDDDNIDDEEFDEQDDFEDNDQDREYDDNEEQEEDVDEQEDDDEDEENESCDDEQDDDGKDEDGSISLHNAISWCFDHSNPYYEMVKVVYNANPDAIKVKNSEDMLSIHYLYIEDEDKHPYTESMKILKLICSDYNIQNL